jgi:transposase, IS30 family
MKCSVAERNPEGVEPINLSSHYHMKERFFQLTREQRYKIEVLFNSGITQTQISISLGVHKSTISRELRRNTPQRGFGAKNYLATTAQAKTDLRHHIKPKQIKFTLDLKNQMLDLLGRRRYSPELIEAQWRKDGINGVSHECMYQFIWDCKHSNKRINRKFKNSYKFLKHGKRRRKRGNYKDSRGLIPNRVSIDKRPSIVEKKKRFGDIEVDLIMGAKHKSAILVCFDRATLMTKINKLEGKDSGPITKQIIRRMKEYPALKTMTFDNDQAFRHHEKIGLALNLKTYFTRPYTSQDKGGIENRNGVIRLFFPKGTDFNSVTTKEIKRVEKEINNRPVRKFNYMTPNEVFLLRR